MNRSLIAIGLIAVLLAVGFAAAYGGVFGGPGPSPSRSPSLSPSPSTLPTATPPATRTPITTPQPSPTPIDTSVRASAVVIPQRSADLALTVSGIVDDLYVGELDPVTANRLLLKLDQTGYLAAIDVAEADVRRAEAALERAQLQVEQLPPDATPGQRESAEAELRLADAELALARSVLAEAQIALRQTELRAPFSGAVAALAVELGEQAIAGEPLITIADMSGWLVETTDLSELEVVRIAVGDEATITFDALPDRVFNGEVERIHVRGTTDTGGVNFAVAIRPTEHNENLRWNMSATVRIAPSR